MDRIFTDQELLGNIINIVNFAIQLPRDEAGIYIIEEILRLPQIKQRGVSTSEFLNLMLNTDIKDHLGNLKHGFPSLLNESLKKLESVNKIKCSNGFHIIQPKT